VLHGLRRSGCERRSPHSWQSLALADEMAAVLHEQVFPLHAGPRGRPDGRGSCTRRTRRQGRRHADILECREPAVFEFHRHGLRGRPSPSGYRAGISRSWRMTFVSAPNTSPDASRGSIVYATCRRTRHRHANDLGHGRTRTRRGRETLRSRYRLPPWRRMRLSARYPARSRHRSSCWRASTRACPRTRVRVQPLLVFRTLPSAEFRVLAPSSRAGSFAGAGNHEDAGVRRHAGAIPRERLPVLVVTPRAGVFARGTTAGSTHRRCARPRWPTGGVRVRASCLFVSTGFGRQPFA